MRLLKRSKTDIDLIKRASRGALFDVQQEVETNEAEFFSLGPCHFVVRSEQTIRGKELVIICMEGKDMFPAMKTLIKNAINQGFDCIRYHPATKKSGKALARIMSVDVTWNSSEQYYISYLGASNGQ
jgi:hypothetical protein